jgi:hypothetical protein
VKRAVGVGMARRIGQWGLGVNWTVCSCEALKNGVLGQTFFHSLHTA